MMSRNKEVLNTTGQEELGTSRTGTSSSEMGLLGSSSCNISTPLVGNQAGVFLKTSGRNFSGELNKLDSLQLCTSPCTSLDQKELKEQTSNPFKRSNLTKTSPKNSPGIGDVFHTPQTGENNVYGAKRKRFVEGYSAEKHPAKSTCLDKDTLNKMEKVVERLCKSVGDSSNTKKEIRDISATLRSLVKKLVSEQGSARMLEGADEGNEIATQTDINVKDMRDANTQIGESEWNVKTCATCDDRTQAGRRKRQSAIRVESIHQLLKNELDQNKLVLEMATNWPGATFTRTITIREDINPEIMAKKNMIILSETANELNDDGSENRGGILKSQVQNYWSNRLIKAGEIVNITSRATLLTEQQIETEPEVNTYLVAVNPCPEKEKITLEVLNCLKKLENKICENKNPDNTCKFYFGTTNRSLETPLRKTLEYLGHRKDMHFSLYTSAKMHAKAKNAKANEPRIVEEQITAESKIQDTGEWKKVPGKSRQKKLETILITPNEGTSYAKILSSMKKEVDPQKCGVQIQRVVNTKKGEVAIKIVEIAKDGLQTFSKELGEKVEMAAKAEIQEQLETVVIRDIDDIVTEDDLKIAIEDKIGTDVPYKLNIIQRRSGASYTHAYLLMPVRSVSQLLKNRRIRAGWSSCRIERKVSPLRCFNCCKYGHTAKECKNASRKNICWKCGELDHKAVDCVNEERCHECEVSGHRADSSKCPTYRKMLEVVRREGQKHTNNNA